MNCYRIWSLPYTPLHMLGKEHSIENEMKTRLEKLERIATQEQFNEIKLFIKS